MQIHEPADELLENFCFIWYLRLLHVLKPFKFPKMFLHLSSLASYWRVLSQRAYYIRFHVKLDGWTAQWIRNWLDDCIQRVAVNNSMPRRSVMSHPQRSVFGPLLFNIFINNTEPVELSELLVCGQHLRGWCCWHKRRKGCHTKGPGQTWELGPCESHEV